MLKFICKKLGLVVAGLIIGITSYSQTYPQDPTTAFSNHTGTEYVGKENVVRLPNMINHSTLTGASSSFPLSFLFSSSMHLHRCNLNCNFYTGEKRNGAMNSFFKQSSSDNHNYTYLSENISGALPVSLVNVFVQKPVYDFLYTDITIFCGNRLFNISVTNAPDYNSVFSVCVAHGVTVKPEMFINQG